MFFRWGFRATIKLHGDDTAPAKLQVGDQQLNVSQFIREKVPILDPTKKLWLNPLLFNGSLQTLYYLSHNSTKKFLVYYGREIFTYADGGVCSLDWVIPPESDDEFKKLYKETIPQDSPRLHPRSRFLTLQELENVRKGDEESTKPLCVILHGLGGGSHEPLIRNLAELITASDFDAVVINSRGCCRTKITTEKLFTAFSTDDVKEVLVELNKRYPHRPIYTVGFSFGACILANYLGSKDESLSLVKAAVPIGCPWDLVDCAYHIQDSWTGDRLLNPALASFLYKIVKNNFKELNGHDPVLFSEESLALAKKTTKTYQFDTIYTSRSVGYTNAFDYYRDASPVNRLRNIKTPTLILNSTDDPAVSGRIPRHEVQSNPFTVMAETDLGGHLGYVQWSGEFWGADVAHEFLNKFDKLVKKE